MAKPKSRSPSKQHQEILNAVRDYRQEANAARITRLTRNRQNWDVYMGNIDWSHKMEGQSTEHLPKMSNGAEQMTAFFRRGLTQFGDWFSVDVRRDSLLTPDLVRELIKPFLAKLVEAPGQTIEFSTILGDAVKQALMESLLIFKVHGDYMTEHSMRVEPGTPLAAPALRRQSHDLWRLRIDLISSEDFAFDPTGRNLYRIHRIERDWNDVWAKAAGPGAIYDPKVVTQLHEFLEPQQNARRLQPRHRGQDPSEPPARRRRVVLEEVWGTILGPDGKPIAEDVVTTIANDRFVIREPEDIGSVFWDAQDPFVVAPVVRIPHSTQHRALFDDVTNLNLALDELFNLMLDGGISAVWGVRQVREHWLADPRQISNGIPQGATLVLSEDAPSEGKAVETVSTGQLPPDSINMFGTLDRETGQAMLTNDVRLGNLPQRQVKATELVQSSENSSVLIEGFTGDLERGVIDKVLAKSWTRIMQFADDIPQQDVVDAIGIQAAFALSRMSPAERYANFAQGLKFKVYGLSATLARAREFQKLMAMNQGVATNPLLMQAFLKKFSGSKMLDHIMRALNINPENLEQTPEEQAAQAQTLQQIQGLAQITGGGTPVGAPQGASMQSDLNQETNPTSGAG